MNGGLDWQVHPAANVATEIDTEVFHSGNRSLLLAFNGQSADEAGISQSIPVQPNTRYELSCYVKSESLEGASGPRFAVSDAYTGASYLLADEFDRSATWRAARSEFQTGPDTKLVRLRIVRVPGNKLMRGRMWIDDVSLLPKGVSRDVQKDVANVSSETSPKMGAQ